MHINWLFSSKVYCKVCFEVGEFGSHFVSAIAVCTPVIVLNDMLPCSRKHWLIWQINGQSPSLNFSP